MISKQTLQLSWINSVSKQKRISDKILVEKVIRALFLLEGLVESGVDFTFKGGTALMLLQNSTRRLSIDIDILIPEKIDLNKVFDDIIESKHFTKFELQERNTTSSINKAHYKFFYQPVYKTAQTEEYVLLDILFEKPQYQNIIPVNIDSSFVQQKSKPLKINIPCFEDLLGDKLTAFAPNTTGIPYEKSKPSSSANSSSFARANFVSFSQIYSSLILLFLLAWS